MKINESILSRSPPCPGNSFPLSLTPISRLMADITTSPQKPLIPINKPANNACNVFSGVSNGPIISDAIMVVMTPPTRPSSVFPGLTLGTTFLLPQDFPHKYCAISFDSVNAKRNKITIQDPLNFNWGKFGYSDYSICDFYRVTGRIEETLVINNYKVKMFL